VTALREGLPPLPRNMARLPIDHRGFPVPWFVQWLKDGEVCPAGWWTGGAPDFRMLDAAKLRYCLFNRPLCWICGNPLGVHRVFAIGPMCAINRSTSEPPSHRGCAEFAAQACPFLAQPRMRRNAKDLPQHGEIPGNHVDHNPGATCLWETKSYSPFRVGNGYLIKLGDAERVDWYAEGKPATRLQVLASIDKGYPQLLAQAKRDGAAGLRELERLRGQAMTLLPAA
jgi:hypothetical protein